MFNIKQKGKELLLFGELMEFIEDEYGEVTESVQFDDMKLAFHYIQGDEHTILFTTGLSFFEQDEGEYFGTPYRMELIAYLPQGLSFEHVSQSERYEFITDIMALAYSSLNDGEPIYHGPIFWSDREVTQLGFSGVTFFWAPMDPSVCKTNMGKVEFLSIVPLYKEEQEFFRAHDFVDIEETLFNYEVPSFVEPGRKMIDISQVRAQAEQLSAGRTDGRDLKQSTHQEESNTRDKNDDGYDEALQFEDHSIMGVRFRDELALIDIAIYETKGFLFYKRYSVETLTNYKNMICRFINEGQWYLWIAAFPGNKVLQKLKITTVLEEAPGYLLEGENLRLFQESALDIILRSRYDFWLTKVKPGYELSLAATDLDTEGSLWDDDGMHKLPECLSALLFCHHSGFINLAIPHSSYDGFREQIIAGRELEEL